MAEQLTEITERLEEIERLLAMAQKRIAEARVLLNFEETPNPLTVSSQAKWAKAYECRLTRKPVEIPDFRFPPKLRA